MSRAASRRLLDVVASAAGLALLALPALVVGAAIRLDSPGPILFRQTRVGEGGRPFSMLKFRSMVADAPRRGPALTIGHDPRITRVGRWLRRTKVDELPQLWNVLRGEMGLVGPRPEVEHYVDMYSSTQRAVLDLRPGITDPASIEFRNEAELLAAQPDPERAYIDEVMPAKIRMNLEYAARATAWSDVGVVLSTLGVLRRGGE